MVVPYSGLELCARRRLVPADCPGLFRDQLLDRNGTARGSCPTDFVIEGEYGASYFQQGS